MLNWQLIGEIRGIDFTPIKFEVSDDLSFWSAEIPGKVVARGEVDWAYDPSWEAGSNA